MAKVLVAFVEASATQIEHLLELEKKVLDFGQKFLSKMHLHHRESWTIDEIRGILSKDKQITFAETLIRIDKQKETILRALQQPWTEVSKTVSRYHRAEEEEFSGYRSSAYWYR